MLLCVRKMRLEKGLRLMEAANLVGVRAPALSAVESGRLAPWPALRGRLAGLYGVPEGELFDDIDAAREFLKCRAGEDGAGSRLAVRHQISGARRNQDET